MWVFDDPDVDLKHEPFVRGMPEIIDRLLDDPNVERFNLIFSDASFPGAVRADWVREDSGGNWYRVEGREGWLCPALFHYFDEAPRELYAQLCK
jgi:hypothetical protein